MRRARVPGRCRTCGKAAPSNRHVYCDRCRPAVPPSRRKSSSARGYGWMHQQLRARWARRVALGRVRCAYCGRLIVRGEPWDLGHDDVDRRRYTGPEHRACNRNVAARRHHSREW